MLHLAHPGHALIHVKAGLLAQGVAAIPAFPVFQWHHGDACLMTVAGAAMELGKLFMITRTIFPFQVICFGKITNLSYKHISTLSMSILIQLRH